ncbi:MAG: copper chaperone PCu(A)C [Rubrivivax sp.]
MSTLAVSTLAVSTLGLGVARACDLRVESAWIRQPPPRAAALAGFATLVNAGRQAHRVVAAESALAGMIMFHETRMQGDMATMRELAEVPVPAGGRAVFAPGGRHLMLMALRAVPRAGDHVTITLIDEAGCRIAGDFVVRAQ